MHASDGVVKLPCCQLLHFVLEALHEHIEGDFVREYRRNRVVIVSSQLLHQGHLELYLLAGRIYKLTEL